VALADDASGDYRENKRTGEQEFNRERPPPLAFRQCYARAGRPDH